MVLAQEKYAFPSQTDQETTFRPTTNKSRHQRPVKTRNKTTLGIFAIVALFLLGVAVAVTYIYPTQLGYRQVGLEKELAQIEKENKQLELTIAKSRSLERVENIAVSKLNMMRPGEMGLMVAARPQTPTPNSSKTATANSPGVQTAKSMVASNQGTTAPGARSKAQVSD